MRLIKKSYIGFNRIFQRTSSQTDKVVAHQVANGMRAMCFNGGWKGNPTLSLLSLLVRGNDEFLNSFLIRRKRNLITAHLLF